MNLRTVCIIAIVIQCNYVWATGAMGRNESRDRTVEPQSISWIIQSVADVQKEFMVIEPDGNHPDANVGYALTAAWNLVGIYERIIASHIQPSREDMTALGGAVAQVAIFLKSIGIGREESCKEFEQHPWLLGCAERGWDNLAVEYEDVMDTRRYRSLAVEAVGIPPNDGLERDGEPKVAKHSCIIAVPWATVRGRQDAIRYASPLWLSNPRQYAREKHDAIVAKNELQLGDWSR
ncbi:MAG: hypothetical protein LBJ42_00405, partial [Holosporales bacterium]|nr:hypothetical protein [Holosporales bacterium]